jgi:hypothetical protein
VDLWIGETAADNRFVSVSGSDFLPDMHLGRLAVNSVAEAMVVVNKIISYEQNPPADDWNRKVMFVADNADQAGDFAYLSDQVANNHLPVPYLADKIYYLQTHLTDISARKAITEGINQGRLMVRYIQAGQCRPAALFGANDLSGRLLYLAKYSCPTPRLFCSCRSYGANVWQGRHCQFLSDGFWRRHRSRPVGAWLV